MASTLLDLVVMTVSSAFGTSSTIPLNAAATVDGVTYLSFATAGGTGGQQVSYSILDTGNSETGTATYTSSNNTLTSRTPTKSTNGGAAIVASSAALIYGTVRAADLNNFIVAGQLPGTATNDSATAGNVGEVKRATASSSNLTSGGTANVASITLSPGDWDIQAQASFNGSGSPSVTNTTLVIAASSTSIAAAVGLGSQYRVTATTDLFTSNVVGPDQVSISSSTTYFANVQASFTGGTYNASVLLFARRRR